MKAIGIAIAGVIATLAGSAQADALEDFYKTKQLRLIVGTSPGGGYDLLARLVARHMGNFVPGKPKVIVENMPGAGSILLANYIYNVAPSDGTAMGLVQRGVLLAQLTEQNGVRFDISKFNWIGNITAENGVVAVWKNSPIKTFADLQARQIAVGSTGPTSDTNASALLLNSIAGTKLKIVSGYPGTAEVLLAMERGELDAVSDLSWSEQIKQLVTVDQSMRVVAQHGETRASNVPDVPATLEFVTDPQDRDVARLYYGLKTIARPIMTGPNVPAERAAALRAAFDAMIKDASFQQDAVKGKWDLSPGDHKSIEDFLAFSQKASPSVRSRITQLLNPAK